MPAKVPTSASNRPVHTIRHRRIEAAIWKNEAENGAWYNVTLRRSYKDGEQWKDTQSFGYDDLMNLAKILYDAHSFISSLTADEHSNGAPPTQAGDRLSGSRSK